MSVSMVAATKLKDPWLVSSPPRYPGPVASPRAPKPKDEVEELQGCPEEPWGLCLKGPGSFCPIWGPSMMNPTMLVSTS